jgi:Zn ribbon nucleic-acid-binding protein
MKIPIEIKKIIKKAKCPECGKQLICGGWHEISKEEAMKTNPKAFEKLS